MKNKLKIPNLELQSTAGLINLSQLKGKKILLYFYPKDNTPGCTLEGKKFRDLYAEFQENNTVIFGVSRDSLDAHQKFKLKKNFPFELISDPDEILCNLFEVIGMKKFFGKEIRGIKRSTFLFDHNGELQQEWRKVKVKEHAEEVLNAIKNGNA